MTRFAATLLVAAATALGSVEAGGAKLQIGAPAPEFKDLPGVDGKKHSLSDYKKDVVVVAVTCNHCPVAVAYEDRLIEFARKYADKVDVVAINVNNGAPDKLDKMKIRAEKKGFNFPYLYDESQAVGHELNAHVTPEFYVFDKNRKLVYWGAMDDNLDRAKVTRQYLEPAVNAALQGQTPSPAVTRAVGCSIQYQSK